MFGGHWLRDFWMENLQMILRFSMFESVGEVIQKSTLTIQVQTESSPNKHGPKLYQLALVPGVFSEQL